MKIKSKVKEYFFISVGSLILAISINMFLAPNKISGGGVGTIATILLHVFGVKISITNFIFNVCLFVLGYKLLGKGALVKTIWGILSLTLFLEATSYLPVYTGDIIVSTMAGGFLMGVGVGFAVRVGASTGGSDFAALMLKRFLPHISVANIILVIDLVIIAFSGVVFKSFTVTVYSIAALYVSSIVTDAIVMIGDAAKGVHIFSSKYDEISKNIMQTLERGVTGVNCIGMYTQSNITMLYCVVQPKELPLLIKIVKGIDSGAFIVINDAREVLGEGFKE